MGRAAHSRRALEAGDRDQPGYGANYMVRHPRPPSQTWGTFLANHADGLASIDLFVIPTATFRVLYAFIVLRHKRRRVFHFDVTSHPTAA